MNILKKIILLALLSVFALSVAGCSSNQKSAEDVLKSYYSSLEKADYKKAYSCLSDDVKKDITYEIFEEYYGVISKDATFKGFAPGTSKTVDDVKSGGKVKYKKAVVIPVEEVYVQAADKKEKKISIERMLAKEGGQYKLIWENNMKRFLSDYYIGLANKALNAEKPDFKAAKANIDTAMQKDEVNPAVYYYKAILSNQDKKYEDSLDSIQKCIDIQEEEIKTVEKGISENPSEALQNKKAALIEGVSYSYNIKGIVLGNTGDVDKALDSFKKALEYHSDNQYAKMNIERIEAVKSGKQVQKDGK